MTTPVCIIAAKRTPFGRFMGKLSRYSAVDLAVQAGRAALTSIDAEAIKQVIVGNVLSAGLGMNIARQVGVKLGLPVATPAFTVNMMCASGLQAVALAAQAIRSGAAGVVLCGGTESMSNAPYLLDRARAGYKLGDGVLIDSLLRDGLVDAFSNEHMALTAERLAERCAIQRAEQDVYALQSHKRYASAAAGNAFADEIAPLPELDRDEHPRADTTLEKLASLAPAFNKEGTITPGNASGINDGAAMLVLCDAKTASQRGWKPLALLGDTIAVGCDPALMGLGPVHAARGLEQRTGLSPDRYDHVEINEAFAAQTLACLRELRLDNERVNPDGGAIALGHPIGASGARLITHLAHRIARQKAKLALAALCVGGGMGVAAVLQQP